MGKRGCRWPPPHGDGDKDRGPIELGVGGSMHESSMTWGSTGRKRQAQDRTESGAGRRQVNTREPAGPDAAHRERERGRGPWELGRAWRLQTQPWGSRIRPSRRRLRRQPAPPQVWMRCGVGGCGPQTPARAAAEATDPGCGKVDPCPGMADQAADRQTRRPGRRRHFRQQRSRTARRNAPPPPSSWSPDSGDVHRRRRGEGPR